jgi:ribonuclease-3
MTSLEDLEEILAVDFQNPLLLEEALTHRSFLNEDRQSKCSNERLEFLGDSVLELIISQELFCRFPAFPEGKLTAMRSSLVRAKTLGKIARELSLGKFLQMSRGEERGGGRENDSLLANTFEAVLGAIYLDQGLSAAQKFLARRLFPLIKEAGTGIFDYKSRLQEVVQETERVTPTYRVTAAVGPDHEKVFTVEALAGDRVLARGRGKSKQEAEQSAARAALEKKEGFPV